MVEDDVKNIMMMSGMMSGPPFIEYDGVRLNEMVRGLADEAAGAVVMG